VDGEKKVPRKKEEFDAISLTKEKKKRGEGRVEELASITPLRK